MRQLSCAAVSARLRRDRIAARIAPRLKFLEEPAECALFAQALNLGMTTPRTDANYADSRLRHLVRSTNQVF